MTANVLGGRYELGALLKSGRGIDTLRGTDLQTGAAVVIKRTAAADVPEGAQLRLEHEANVLRDLASPWIAPLLDVRREGEILCIVMPFVPGIALSERIARGPLPVPSALAVGRDLLRALQAAHERGVLHRDVKPANLIVSDDTTAERVTLIDFGLARSRRLDASVRDVPVGTVWYVSPEQAGLIHTEVGERSDLYSAGVVLFECLAGARPFDGRTVAEILRQRLTLRPPTLRRAGSNVPRAVDEVVQRLLAKDPRNRYQSAASALADLDEIAAALERGVAEPDVVVGARDRSRALTEPAFVGREKDLRRVEKALAALPAGRSLLLLLEGDSGAGKSRLLEEVSTIASQRGAWVLRGQATDRAVRPALQPFQDVAEEVVRAANADAVLRHAIRAPLEERGEDLCRALPQLGRLLAPSGPRPFGPERFGEERALAALVSLVGALGTPTRPAVLLLDDCQWLDDVSMKLLARWHHEYGAGGRRGCVLIVAAYRSEETSDDSPLRELVPPPPKIVLEPLSPRDVRRLAESMVGALRAEAVQLVERLAEGNPFLAGAVLEGLFEAGALVDTPSGWQLDPTRMTEAQSSRRVAALLASRLESLPPPVLHLLSVGALLGKSFELRLAADLAGQSAAQAITCVSEARRRRFVWIDAVGSRCTFVHDRLRDAVLDRLGPAERRRLHGAAASALERREHHGIDIRFELAHHYDAAGEHARALPHALAAASHARAQYALEVAERCYRIAQRGARATGGDAGTLRRVADGLGDVLLMRGKYEDAAAALAEARLLAETALERAAIEGKIGELAFKRGDVPSASAALERALAVLGRRVPKTPFRLLAATLAQALVQLAHTAFPWLVLSRRRLEDGDAELLAARILSRLAYAYWFGRGQVATFWAHLSEMNIAERYPPTRELAQAYSEHSISVTGLPRFLFARGERYAKRGLAIRASLGDVWGQGQSLNFHGMLLYAFGHYREALDKFGEAFRLLGSTGDRWEANVAGTHLAYCHFRLGSLHEALAEARRVHATGAEIGDLHAMGAVLEVWSKATGGAVPAELVEEALRRSGGDPQIRESVLQAEGVRLIREGRASEAARAFAAADEVARSVHLRSEYVSYIPLWVAHAQRLAAAQAAAETGVLSPGSLREAKVALRRGLSAARRHRGNLPMALRERAYQRTAAGQGRRARRDLAASLAEAERQGALYEVALTLLARADIGRLLRWPTAAEDAAKAESALHGLGADFAYRPLGASPGHHGGREATFSLADRFATIVDHGRRIASALTPEGIHAALCEGASALLRGEATAVVALEAGGLRVLAHRGSQVELSRSWVERALREGRPTVLAQDLEVVPSDSLVLANLRSALCAPIPVNRGATACLCVTHASAADVFAEDEKRLAVYLVTLAGASLEKADAFAALQALSCTLEERVEARTAELRGANLELDASLRRLRETQEQLIQAAKMAAVGTLVAGLSHELNNPLGVILGYASTYLRVASPDDPVRPAMAAIERQARRCADLVLSLLDFSRKGPAEREEIPVETLVSRAVTLASLKMRRREVDVHVNAPAHGARLVRVSPTEIESALLNVLDNAADASPPRSVIDVDVVARPRDLSPGVEIRVRDHGSGIERDMLQRIFDPFFTTKPPGQGTGLGLPLARQFVEVHGGELRIESRPGEGTTATIWLPTTEGGGPTACSGNGGA